MRPLPRPTAGARRRPAAVVLATLLAVPLLTAPAAGCGPSAVAHVRQAVTLEDDGAVRTSTVERSATDGDGGACATSRDLEADALPLAVAILHRDATEGPVEASRLGDVDGPVTTAVAVRDRSAQERTLTVARADGDGSDEVTRTIGIPHLVRVSVRYPASWSRIVPDQAGVRTDVRDGGLEVSDARLLFPPLTDDELRFTIRATPGRGVPTVTVEATPIGPSTAALLDADPLGRDAAAVVGALTAVSVDGARQLAEGTDDLADGVAELADGAGELAVGLDEAATGFGPLGSGTRELADGADELAGGVRGLADGLPELGGGAAALGAGNRDLAEALREAADGADELAEGNEQAAAGNQQLADATAGLVVASEALDGGAATLREVLEGLDALPVGVLDGIVQPLLELVTQAEQLAGAAAAISAGNAELAEANRQLAEGNRELAEGLREAADGADELGAGNEELATGAGEAAAGADALADGTAELADGADQLADGVTQAADGLGEAAAGADALADGGQGAADGAAELADGADQLPEALDQARGTADRDLERDAERAAVVAAGRERAEQLVADATDAPEGTLATTLTASGQDPVSPWTWAAVALALAAAAAVVAVLRRQRRSVA